MGRCPHELLPIADAYMEAIERFHTWCDARSMDFRVELTRMIANRVGGIDLPASTPPSQRSGRPRLSDNERRLRHRAYYQANKERIKAYMREYARRRKTEGAVHV